MTPERPRTDLELPRVENVVGAERKRRKGRKRRGGGGEGSAMLESATRRSRRTQAQALTEESEDEEDLTRISIPSSSASPAVAAASLETGATTAMTEQNYPSSQFEGGMLTACVTGAVAAITVAAVGAILAPVVAAGAVAAAGTTMIVNNLSNDNRAIQESHDQRMIAEAQIEAARDVQNHKASVKAQECTNKANIKAQERVMMKMVDKGHYAALDLFANGHRNGRSKKRIGGPRRAGLLEYDSDTDSCRDD